jgi:hypothetical protein
MSFVHRFVMRNGRVKFKGAHQTRQESIFFLIMLAD